LKAIADVMVGLPPASAAGYSGRMESTSPAEITALRSLIEDAKLAPDAKHTALWCVDQLPKLYAEFERTNESRHGDAIRRLGQAVLKRMGEDGAGADAGRVGDALVAQLGGLHQRLGFAPLPLKPGAAPAKGHRKKSA
jgi:hypothetical protein